MTEQKFIWPVIVTGNCPEIILSPEHLTKTTRLHRRFTMLFCFLKNRMNRSVSKNVIILRLPSFAADKRKSKRREKKKKMKPVTDSESSSDLFKKFPAYDVHIHVHRKDKKYAAHTPQQWQEVRDLLARGFSLMGKKKAYYFDVCIDCLEMTGSYWYIKK